METFAVLGLTSRTGAWTEAWARARKSDTPRRDFTAASLFP
jgi:hypothetical protein